MPGKLWKHLGHLGLDDKLRVIATVTLGDGRTVQRMRYYASGTPQAPLTKEQIGNSITVPLVIKLAQGIMLEVRRVQRAKVA